MRFVLEVEGEGGGVDRHVVLPREVLLPRGKEALGEEEAADPENLSFAQVRVYGLKSVMAKIMIMTAGVWGGGSTRNTKRRTGSIGRKYLV